VQIFFGRGGLVFLLGVLEKTGDKTRCFGGDFVVVCMVKMVVKQPQIWLLKMRHGFRIYFLGFPFWECGLRFIEKATHDMGLLPVRIVQIGWV
jgi:hypothetical protein